MNWDIVIYIVVLLQLVALGFLAFVLLQLKNGPLLRSIRLGMKLVKTGTGLGVSGITLFSKNRLRGEELVREVKGIVEGMQYGTRTDFGDRISYRSLFAGWLSLQTTLGSVAAILGFLQGLGKKIDAPPSPKGTPTKPIRPPRRSLADRMGLVPPAAKPLGRVLNFGRIAWEIRNEMKRRGLSPF